VPKKHMWCEGTGTINGWPNALCLKVEIRRHPLGDDLA